MVNPKMPRVPGPLHYRAEIGTAAVELNSWINTTLVRRRVRRHRDAAIAREGLSTSLWWLARLVAAVKSLEETYGRPWPQTYDTGDLSSVAEGIAQQLPLSPSDMGTLRGAFDAKLHPGDFASLVANGHGRPDLVQNWSGWLENCECRLDQPEHSCPVHAVLAALRVLIY